MKKCCICHKKGEATYHDIQSDEKLYLCKLHGRLWEISQERKDFFHDHKSDSWGFYFKKWLLKYEVITKEMVQFT